jgi:hypothetical protein
VRVTLYDLQPSALTTEGVSYDSPPPCVVGIGDINQTRTPPVGREAAPAGFLDLDSGCQGRRTTTI